MKYKKGWIAVIVLAVLSPLGLLAIGEAWGEWDNETLKHLVGFVPEGMNRIKDMSPIAFLKDYSIPGFEGSFAKTSIGTIISALIGAGLTALIMYFIAAGRKQNERS
ncbi:MAG: hypothetical protein B6D63_00965 [Candidatus Latescibacteria bacterium 4484_7]|nr:MAG: hypothetical protein B6D63_00965 [Candidatus Latescibacteria bacterium 4484_7]